MKKLLLTFLPLFTLTAEASTRSTADYTYIFFLVVVVGVLIYTLEKQKKSTQEKMLRRGEQDYARAIARGKAKAKEKAKKKAKEKAKAIARGKAKAKEKAKEKAKAIADAKAKAKAEEIIEEQRLAKEKLDADLSKLRNSLPFYTSNSSNKFSDTNGDNSRWHYVVEAVKKCDTTETILYFVKVKSLNDDDEYYKIGVTTHSIASRFFKSTDAELLEEIASHKMEKRLALFAEFHFIREFRPDDDANDGGGFSGYTEIVKPNSIRKITSLFSTLPEYVTKASSFLS